MPVSTGSGPNNSVHSLSSFNSKLIIGGHFTSCDMLNTLAISSFDGSSYDSLAQGLSGAALNYPKVLTSINFNGNLVVGGNFERAGQIILNNVAMWNGTNWIPLGGGIIGQASYDIVTSLAVYNNELYAAGNFSLAGGVNANSIAKWNGTSWSPVWSGGPPMAITSMAVYNNDLYVGGSFSNSFGVSAAKMAKWNGASWSAMTDSINGTIFSMYSNSSGIYVGGAFDLIGGLPVGNIAKWNGSNWTALGSGMLGDFSFPVVEVVSLIEFNGGIVAGGFFKSADGTTDCSHIALWNGTNWMPMAHGFDGPVLSLAVHNSELYAGGYFQAPLSSSEVTNFLAKYSLATSIRESKRDVERNLYPNPANSYITINYERVMTGSKVRVVNVMNQHIKTCTITGKSVTIDFENVKSGMYYVLTLEKDEIISYDKITVAK
ncbi:MAG: hypothetical protein K0S53_2168 [Bacteroidetes bacterium]|nr:hypothetical protein [Bacteroidota bacterium]MDF2453175.1 hypothetical protein [Bacteroidota bacterium]